MIAHNPRARFDYVINEVFEAGIVLTGPEVKSAKAGKVSLKDAFAVNRGDEVFLQNCHIAPYGNSDDPKYFAKRPRKLLLHRREINKLIGAITKKGMTIVPLKMIQNNKNLIKLEIALVIGKKKYDKRQAEKEKEWKRKRNDILKNE